MSQRRQHVVGMRATVHVNDAIRRHVLRIDRNLVVSLLDQDRIVVQNGAERPEILALNGRVVCMIERFRISATGIRVRPRDLLLVKTSHLINDVLGRHMIVF